MPHAVTHILTSIVLVDLYRDYITKHKKYFSLYAVFLAGFFGLFPDIDVLLGIFADLLNINIPPLLEHGMITHTPFFALLFLIPAIILWKLKKHKQSIYFYMAFFGITFHLLLDFILGGGSHYGMMLLFPFSMEQWKIHLFNQFDIQSLPQALDAIILIAWLWHEEKKHKIKDFI